jgi:hypothetical protein
MIHLNTFQVLLPAIILHGSFDFLLMCIPIFFVIYGTDELWLLIAGLFITIFTIVFGSMYYAYRRFMEVREYRNYNDEVHSLLSLF